MTTGCAENDSFTPTKPDFIYINPFLNTAEEEEEEEEETIRA